MADRARGQRRRWGLRLALVLGSLGAGFLLAEGLARLLVGTPLAERRPILAIRPNPWRGWAMQPGLHYTYEHPVHVNSHGLRGPEIPPAQEDDAVRVLALGDSLIYGQGVADDETVPWFLERSLEGSDPEERDWRVMNGGHRGYDTGQELGLLEELGPELEPDVVLLFWYWNDCDQDDPREVYEGVRAKGAGVTFDTGTRLEGWELLRWEAIQLVRRSALVMHLHDRWRARKATPRPRRWFENGVRLFRRNLKRLRESERELGFDPLVVVLPDANRLLGRGETEWVEEAVAAAARERSLPVVEPLEALRALRRRRGELPVVPFDGHYDAGANRAIAEAVADGLLAAGLPNRAP